jgi:predicted ester cyclase
MILLKVIHRQGVAVKDLKQFLTDFINFFPDWGAKIEHIIAENNLVLIFLNGTGTHKTKFHAIPPTNKPINIRSADLYKIENGIITGHWDVVDQLNLLKQTGALFPK